MDILTAIGLALPAGLNAYIPLLGLALAQRFGVLALAQPWDTLGEWWVIGLVSALLLVELLADKVPAVDHVNDAIQTIVRPAAGAVVAVAASGQAGENYPVVMVALGVILAGGVHVAKATARPIINASTGGAGAPAASTVEDIASAVTTALAIFVPILIIGVVGLFAWLAWRFTRGRARLPDA